MFASRHYLPTGTIHRTVSPNAAHPPACERHGYGAAARQGREPRLGSPTSLNPQLGGSCKRTEKKKKKNPSFPFRGVATAASFSHPSPFKKTAVCGVTSRILPTTAYDWRERERKTKNQSEYAAEVREGSGAGASCRHAQTTGFSGSHTPKTSAATSAGVLTSASIPPRGNVIRRFYEAVTGHTGGRSVNAKAVKGRSPFSGGPARPEDSWSRAGRAAMQDLLRTTNVYLLPTTAQCFASAACHVLYPIACVQSPPHGALPLLEAGSAGAVGSLDRLEAGCRALGRAGRPTARQARSDRVQVIVRCRKGPRAEPVRSLTGGGIREERWPGQGGLVGWLVGWIIGGSGRSIFQVTYCPSPNC